MEEPHKVYWWRAIACGVLFNKKIFLHLDLIFETSSVFLHCKGLRGHKSPNIISVYLDQVQGLLICLLVAQEDSLFNQEERVAG